MFQSRDLHDEASAAFETDVAAMRAGNPTANCEAEAVARAVPGANEPFENARTNLIWHAGSVIVDDDGSVWSLGPHGDIYGGAGMPYGVVEQITDDLRDAPLVGIGENRSRVEIDARRSVAAGVLASDARNGVADVDGLALELVGSAGTRQEGEIGDQARGVECGTGDRFERRTFRIARIDRGFLRYARYRSERRP